MKPSTKPNVAGVLSSHAECMVLLGELEDFEYPLDPENEVARNMMIDRFNSQAMSFNWSRFDHEMNSRPEFDVLECDVDFVLKAARAVLEVSSRPERVVNKLTGRTKAAKMIVGFFETRNE